MLVLARKVGESIHIGDSITLVVVEVCGGKVRLGFEAPDTVGISRAELGKPVPPSVKRSGKKSIVCPTCLQSR